jgi:hypothetical protein
LVVVEAGAHVSGLRLAPDGDGDEDTVVVRQMDGEPSSVLAARAIARLALIERSGSAVQRAVMLIAPRRDGQSMAARHLLARALLTHAHVNHDSAAELRLSVGGDADAALRDELLALVELLVGTPGSAVVPIRVQFGPPEEPSRRAPRQSGIFTRSTTHDVSPSASSIAVHAKCTP